jgi:hypothetical protein
MVDLSYKGTTITFSCNTFEERESLYTELKNWRFNIKTETK